MPDMTGWQLAKELRTANDLTDMKIVIVSANAQEFNPGGTESHIHDGFVIKPIELDTLLESIRSVLNLTWTREAVSQPIATGDAAATLPEQSRHHIDDLYQLGRIGHVRGIQSKLRAMEREDPSNKPFATHLQKLVSNFDLKRYMSILEGMRKNG
jgi:DNA-binding NarL/FixJ family response regulator